jgi:crotonobetainyl-CoA:carnitine CoA-transferase CaiB-like acyl-CoA transferase
MGALRDVVVLELCTGVAGPYVGRVFADVGARVIKVEPPGGDPIRGEEPLVDGESAFFNWLNAGKECSQRALDDPSVDELAAIAHVIVHCERGPAGDALDARLKADNPDAVIVSLSPYGRSGERSGWKASPLTEWATGGYHYFGGAPDREPIALPGYQAEFHAGMHAAVGALAGLWHVREGGEGQLVEVSHQEAVLSDHSWLISSWTHQGKVQGRTGSMFAKCADGYIFLFNLVPYPNLFVLMERFDLLEDESLQAPAEWWARWPEVFGAFGEWAATRTKQEIYHACQELRIAASPVNTMEDVANSTQLAARDWFDGVEVGGRTFVGPGLPFPVPHDLPSPAAAGEGSGVRAGSRPAASRLPLDGIRVIEVTANWAGPIGGRHLADLGADVIKVELATKPATRALMYVGDDAWPEHYNRSGYFNKMNRNKRDVCLNLATPEGKDVFLRLVSKADVVLENNAARVMNQLGVGYEALREVNPGLVMCSMSGFGSTGPERNYSAYGSNIETTSGLASLLGYDESSFYGTGTFYADPITGTHGSIAILAALLGRRDTGHGQWIDMALLEAVAPFFAQQFLQYTVTGKLPVPNANRSERYCPQNVYPTVGRDSWLALTVQDTQDWTALCAVIGRQDWAGEPRLRTVEGRRECEAEIEAAIREWCATRDHVTAAEALQAAGVPAAPVLQNWELISDNHLHDRDFFVKTRHPEAGTHWFPGFPWRFEKTPARLRMPAPMFAEHNREVFREVAGLSDDQIAALYTAGITSDAPIYAGGPSI